MRYFHPIGRPEGTPEVNVKMRRLYLYPIPVPGRHDVNPYMECLCNALKRHYWVINAGNPSRSGIFDILRYLGRCDLVYLNWVEEVSDLRFGNLQGMGFLFILILLKALGIKVVWTLHNKQSHWSRNARIKNMLFRQMLKRSDAIITHAEEGLRLIPERIPSLFIHHPVRQITGGTAMQSGYEYDIIIWGNIAPYKGVDTFIGYLNDSGRLPDYRILLAGKVTSAPLLEKLNKLLTGTDKMTLLAEHVEERKLMELIRKSRLVVFTYHSESVLSSGALMDSLSQCATVIGPHAGAFRDLYAAGLIHTFKDYHDLTGKIDFLLKSDKNLQEQKEKIRKFINDNSWENFSTVAGQFLDGNL